MVEAIDRAIEADRRGNEYGGWRRLFEVHSVASIPQRTSEPRPRSGGATPKLIQRVESSGRRRTRSPGLAPRSGAEADAINDVICSTSWRPQSPLRVSEAMEHRRGRHRAHISRSGSTSARDDPCRDSARCTSTDPRFTENIDQVGRRTELGTSPRRSPRTTHGRSEYRSASDAQTHGLSAPKGYLHPQGTPPLPRPKE